MKRTFQPSVLKRKRAHGFQARRTKTAAVIARCRAKGRKRLSADLGLRVPHQGFPGAYAGKRWGF